MDFSLNDEQKMMIDTVRRFIAEELKPLEDEIENDGFLADAKAKAVHKKAKALGLYGMNMPAELGGGGLSNLDRLYANVPALWAKHVFSDTVRTRLVRNRHGDSSGVRGAAWLWNTSDHRDTRQHRNSEPG